MKTVTLIGVLLSGMAVFAQERCMNNHLGEPICSPQCGFIGMNRLGEIVCAQGGCITDRFGDLICSKQQGGTATTNFFGDVVCTGGCEPASAQQCQKPY